ncbi:MAG: respiratory nitrate reductase subunit gamma [Deltaproteobacteria bacterium]|nr:respiratory nitrate reductase subunit gamma [Deltaproteobacteria bacterium]
MNMLDSFLFVALPYLALVIFAIGCIYRYRQSGFTVSSFSSQFLEGRKLFWGSVPFHWGIVVVFFGHLLAFMFPKTQLLWNSQPIRLIILEVTAFTFGVLVLVGLVGLIVRRLSQARIRVVTSPADIFIEFLLLAQVILGCWSALGYRWGSSWFAADLSPYLWSIFKFNPEIGAVQAMPWVIKLHIVGAFLIILLVPFTRLIHFLMVPLHYVWRPYQVVIWYWDRKKVRRAETVWTVTRPRNN